MAAKITIRAAFFDLYNTLAQFSPPREELQEIACKQFGVIIDPKYISKGYYKADEFMAKENARYPISTRPKIEQANFFSEYEYLILHTAGSIVGKNLAGQIYAFLDRLPHRLELFDDVIPVLNKLKSSMGITIGLISNLPNDSQFLSNLGLDPYLDILVTSDKSKSMKPHREIFDLAIKKSMIPASECIHVGDQYHSDILGARAARINPILIDRYGNFDKKLDCPRIRNLAELVTLLEAGVVRQDS